VQAIGLLVKHILETMQQIRTKQLMASLTSQLMDRLQPHPGVSPQMIQQLQSLGYGGPANGQPTGPSQGPGASPPLAQPGPPGAPGDIQEPPQQVGSQGAPVPHDGMM
jgi:hypothetical protein